MEQLTQLVTDINSFIWGLWCLIPLLCGTGLYFTIRLKFVQIRKFPEGHLLDVGRGLPRNGDDLRRGDARAGLQA